MIAGEFPDPVFLAAGRRGSTAVEELLHRARIDFVSSSGIAESSVHGLRDALRDCRAVAAFVRSTHPPPGVLLEIGAGLGRGLPVVLLLAPKVSEGALPAPLRDLPSMRVPAPVTDMAAERLRALLTFAASRASASQIAPSSPINFGEHAELASELARTAASALQALGADVVVHEPQNTVGRPDFAVWMQSLAGVAYNPVLVEVAGRGPDIRAKEVQLRVYMREAEALLGIVIVPDDHAPELRVSKSGAVLVVGLSALSEMDRVSFSNLLRTARNRLFHGS